MNLDAWSPFVLPHAPDVPYEALVHHVRQAAIRFFQLSKCWRESLEAVLGDGVSTSFVMTPDDQVQIVTLYGVQVGDCARQLIPAGDALALVAHGFAECAWTDDLELLNVLPAPSAGVEVRVRAALKPSQKAWELPDTLFDQHAQAIANGALSTLFAMPAKVAPWANPQLAIVYATAFGEDIATASFQATRGNVARYARRSVYRSF